MRRVAGIFLIALPFVVIGITLYLQGELWGFAKMILILAASLAPIFLGMSLLCGKGKD